MTHSTEANLTTRLRQRIANEHEAIEQTPYSVALMRGTLTRNNYALTLAQMFYVHEKLEVLAQDRDELQPFFLPEMVRSTVILRDLNRLDFKLNDFSKLRETSRMTQTFERQVIDCPLSMIGGLYVLEGSRMGSLVLAKPLVKCLGISGAPDSGIDYHIDGAREVPMRLKTWKQLVDQTAFEPSTAAAIEEFAGSLMRQLLDLYVAIPDGGVVQNVA